MAYFSSTGWWHSPAAQKKHFSDFAPCILTLQRGNKYQTEGILIIKPFQDNLVWQGCFPMLNYVHLVDLYGTCQQILPCKDPMVGKNHFIWPPLWFPDAKKPPFCSDSWQTFVAGFVTAHWVSNWSKKIWVKLIPVAGKQSKHLYTQTLNVWHIYLLLA